jgi:hypothetical protein
LIMFYTTKLNKGLKMEVHFLFKRTMNSSSGINQDFERKKKKNVYLL